jgi:D-amino-acid oxidase
VTSVSDDVLVIGAGVIGLTTAVCLAEAGVRTRVMSTDLPRQTTSAMAGAMWGPAFAEPADRALDWSRVGLAEFTRLARDPATGVRLTRGRMASRGALPLDDLPPQVTMVPDLVNLRRAELPAGFTSGQWARVPMIDMPRYLGYLTGRLTAAGGRLDIRTVGRLSEVVDEAPVLVNCSGVGARRLVPDLTVRACRGQLVVVANPGIEEFFLEISTEPEFTHYFPHGDQVVLGGVSTVGDWRLEPDAAVASAIIERCAAVEPLLAGAPILEHRVGLRPERAAIRLEARELAGRPIVHCYGHGSLGVTLSWGSARDAADLAKGLIRG